MTQEDDLSEERGFSRQDQNVLKLWDENCRQVDGHYELPIPWKEGVEFSDNKGVVAHRLHSLKENLSKKGMYERYDAEIRKLLEKGYAEQVPKEQIRSKERWYLPHHPVVTEKKPGKMRIVFDCAAKHNGECLNDKAFQGPDLNNQLAHVLLRFRQHPHAFMADIESMYNQVKVPEAHRNYLRFLWYNEEGEVEHYRMTSHLFGGVWCASLATYALRQVAHEKVDQSVRDTINSAFYVDDCLKSVREKDETQSIIEKTTAALMASGFRLTKFVTTSSEQPPASPLEDTAENARPLGSTGVSKALGLKWDVALDHFGFDVVHYEHKDITRRKMLSYLSSLYDPLGLVGPVVLKARMLYQEAVRLKLDWDDAVPEALSTQWLAWVDTLQDVRRLEFPRCMIPSNHKDAHLELHHFSDASERAYGCCSYLRCVNKNGQVHTTLIMSKSRVAPIKSLTIPRLELQAAVQAARVDAMLKKQLDIQLGPSYCWTDSEIVLRYIKNEERRFHVFVTNRVKVIRGNTEPEQWRHVRGTDNPADIISRGCTASDIDANMWLKGPKFLRMHKSTWSEERVGVGIEEGDPEVKRTVSLAVMAGGVEEGREMQHPLDALIDYYSSWQRLKRSVAWMLRVKQQLKSKGPKGKRRLTIMDLELAERTIIKHCQKGLNVKSAEYRSLNPVKDEHGIIRTKGRVSNPELQPSGQAIIPKGRVAQLLIDHFHEKGHLGTEHTLAQLRAEYWVQRKVVKSALRLCITCRKINGRLCSQKMADLPDTRMAMGDVPFAHAGVDCFGPFLVKRGRSMVKRYGCVFTCLTMRAVHVEVLDSLDTDSFVNAVRRFIARRGKPISITSDNGGNFVKGNKELSAGLKELDQDTLDRTMLERGIDWKFNPPHASHMGGIWERQIRTIRKVLQGIVHEQTLSDESLRTLMCEVESIVNSRPLTPMSDNINDLHTLNPNHLLLTREGPNLPPCATEETDRYRKRWRQVQYLATLFWRRWKKQYLPELQRRQKWLQPKPNISKGDLVLLQEENVPRNLWPMGRVIDTYPSKDGLVRSVKLKTKNTELVRPVTKIVMLEGRLY